MSQVVKGVMSQQPAEIMGVCSCLPNASGFVTARERRGTASVLCGGLKSPSKLVCVRVHFLQQLGKSVPHSKKSGSGKCR